MTPKELREKWLEERADDAFQRLTDRALDGLTQGGKLPTMAYVELNDAIFDALAEMRHWDDLVDLAESLGLIGHFVDWATDQEEGD